MNSTQGSIPTLRSGVDTIEIERIAQAVAVHGLRFLDKVYTVDELAYCGRRAESLAARFAVKEAVAKALGTGIWRQGIGWRDIEVVRDGESGAPSLSLHGAAAERSQTLGLAQWSISLTHDRHHAIAFVVALGACP